LVSFISYKATTGRSKKSYGWYWQQSGKNANSYADGETKVMQVS